MRTTCYKITGTNGAICLTYARNARAARRNAINSTFAATPIRSIRAVSYKERAALGVTRAEFYAAVAALDAAYAAENHQAPVQRPAPVLRSMKSRSK